MKDEREEKRPFMLLLRSFLLPIWLTQNHTHTHIHTLIQEDSLTHTLSHLQWNGVSQYCKLYLTHWLTIFFGGGDKETCTDIRDVKEEKAKEETFSWWFLFSPFSSFPLWFFYLSLSFTISLAVIITSHRWTDIHIKLVSHLPYKTFKYRHTQGKRLSLSLTLLSYCH